MLITDEELTTAVQRVCDNLDGVEMLSLGEAIDSAFQSAISIGVGATLAVLFKVWSEEKSRREIS